MIIGDFHTHTEFSTDSKAPVQAVLDAAVAKGLKTICITDHWDEDYPKEYQEGEKENFRFDMERYFQELDSLKEAYAEKIQLRIGVELGLQPHLGNFYKQLTGKYPFDFVIGSVHLVERKDPYFGELSQKYTDEQIYRKALEETIQNLAAVEDFDVLGHIDYVVRYGIHQDRDYSYERFQDELDEILKQLIVSGRGIELNTAGWKYGLNFCHPHPDVLKRYRELGGEIITVGSDSHNPEHVGYDFKKAEEMLKTCGFRYYTQFVNREPVFLKI